jgi:CubicO group peptidase (beta-lactamase class C family)
MALVILLAAAPASWSQEQAGVAKPADQTPVFPGAEWSLITQPESVGYDSKGLAEAIEYVRTLDTTGLMVVVGGRVLLQYGDVAELSYLASCRKSVLAMLYGKYVENGTIRLDATLKELGMTDHGGLLPIEQEATVGNLIAARSGVYHEASNGGDSLADAPPRGSQQPGTYFLYSNWDFNAAGAAFERMTGMDIFDALQRDLAAPIGMQDFVREEQKKLGDLDASVYPAYHMWLSTRDMARLGYLMLREGNWNGSQVVPREWAKKISSVVTPLEEMNPVPMRQGRLAYGYMWWVWDGPKASGAYEGAYTARGAYGQYITVLPAVDMVVAHKTAVPPERNVNMIEYAGIFERVIGARIRK